MNSCTYIPIFFIVAISFATSGTFAQFNAEDPLDQLEGVDIEEKLNEKIPLDIEFTDDKGNAVKVGDYLEEGKPIILTPVYYNCPQLCTLVLNGLVDGLRDVEWSAGEEFDIVTYTIAEEEDTKMADLKKRAYLTQYDRESATKGWHFLTGSKESIDQLSEAIGFRFKHQPDKLIAHSASVVFITPDGRISRYMNDVLFKPRDLKYALIESSEGVIGTPMDRFLLFNCFQYDPDANSYVASAFKIMRLGGVLTIIGLTIGLGYLWLKGPKIQTHSTRIETVGGAA